MSRKNRRTNSQRKINHHSTRSKKPSHSQRYSIQPDIRHNLYRFAKFWIKLLSAITSAIFLTTLLAALGLATFQPPPLLNYIRLHPVLSITASSVLVLISFFSWFFSRGAIPQSGKKVTQPDLRQDRNVLYATSISTTSFIICSLLLSLILFRPAWCPTWLCPEPVLILNQQGIHDNNLELYFQTVQSSTYYIPDDPAHYTLNNLPIKTSALRIDTPNQAPYRVVLGVQSLQQGSLGLIIEKVILLVKQVTLVPYPLNIWTEGETRNYQSNLYQILYQGQESGSRLLAVYTPLNRAFVSSVQLIPGESDELDIQVTSRIAVELHFQVQVMYRVINESQEKSITLPNTFDIVFSNVSNWYPYHLQYGHLVAGS